jgi:hypothetical protein
VDGSLIAVVDAAQRTNVPGVYAAGETTGVGSAQLSLVEGELAGLAAAAALSGTSPASPADIRRLTARQRPVSPWHGVMVATALPLREDLSVDYDRYAEHVRWLVDAGCDGVCPNGSLGEYQTLTDEKRARIVRTAVEAVDGDRVMPGVGAYGSAESRRWAEQARDAGAGAVLLLPPNSYRADDRIVVEAHYAEVAKAGVPVVTYNNPHDTKVDLTPPLLARLHAAGRIVAVKEFPRRCAA